jgi:hypothetical protein
MKKQWAVLLFAAILVAFSAGTDTSNAQTPSRSTAVSGRARVIPELGSVEQLKEAFQNDTGKVRMIALISPT